MKTKLISSIIIFAVALSSLLGCGKKSPPLLPAESNPAVTPGETSSSEEFASFPLETGELIFNKGESVSVNQLVRNFGMFNSVQSAYSPGTGKTYLRFEWADIVAEMICSEGFSLEGSGDSGWVYGGKPTVLTDEDKERAMTLFYIGWRDQDIANKRGIKPGTSLHEITNSYPGIIDIDGPFALEEYDNGELMLLGLRGCGRVLRVFTEPSDKFTATATQAFPNANNADINYYEYAAFFFEGNTLIAMSQGAGGSDFAP